MMQNAASGERILFVGLGAMGWPMAARLVNAGFAVEGRDARSVRAEAFNAEFGKANAALDTNGPTVVITMLPNSAIVEDVLFGETPLSAELTRSTLLLEMSSGAPARTLAIAERLEPLGIDMVDAPVSGGVTRAVTGDLAIMVGGKAEPIERARPILEAMGSSIMVTGPLGSAHAMKALNNLVSAGGFLIGVEALLIGRKFGLDPKVMVDVLNVSSGMNNSTQKKFAQFVLSRSFDSGFSLDLMLKDLSIATALAEELNVAAPFADACRKLWVDAARTLGPGHDHTALALAWEQLAKVKLTV